MAAIDITALRAHLDPLLAWSYTGGFDGLNCTFFAYRAAGPSVALVFPVRPERFPVATVQEVVHLWDPDASAIMVETNLRTAQGRTPMLLIDILAHTHANNGHAVQEQYAFAVERSVYGREMLGEQLPVANPGDSLIPLAAIPRLDLAEYTDPGPRLLVPDDARPSGGAEAAVVDAAMRRRIATDVEALNRWATTPRPLPRVAVVGGPAEVELRAANGLRRDVATLHVR